MGCASIDKPRRELDINELEHKTGTGETPKKRFSTASLVSLAPDKPDLSPHICELLWYLSILN